MGWSTERKLQPLCHQCPWWEKCLWSCSHWAETKLINPLVGLPRPCGLLVQDMYFGPFQNGGPGCFSSATSYHFLPPLPHSHCCCSPLWRNLYKFPSTNNSQHEPWGPCLGLGLAHLLWGSPIPAYGPTHHAVWELSDFIFLGMHAWSLGTTT